MLGFSLTKIVFTVVVVYLVWNAFKYFTRLQENRERDARVKSQRGAAKPASQSPPRQDGVEDMVECKACGAYVTRGAKSCGRADCPF